jgi:hypothetical protein
MSPLGPRKFLAIHVRSFTIDASQLCLALHVQFICNFTRDDLALHVLRIGATNSRYTFYATSADHLALHVRSVISTCKGYFCSHYTFVQSALSPPLSQLDCQAIITSRYTFVSPALDACDSRYTFTNWTSADHLALHVLRDSCLKLLGLSRYTFDLQVHPRRNGASAPRVVPSRYTFS